MVAKQREMISKWIESLGKSPPKLLGPTFCGLAFPLFYFGYCTMVTPYDDPLFLDYLQLVHLSVVAKSALFVSFF